MVTPKSNPKIIFPAEWAQQSAIMLTWPHRNSIWAETLSAIDDVFVATAKAITTYEKLIVTCFDHQHQQYVVTLLIHAQIDLAKVRFYLSASDDIWVRDHGPITILKNNKAQLLDFTFNGWGQKYPAAQDNELTKNIAKQGAFAGTSLQTVDIVLEGGALETDGHGTLLTTRNCVLAKTRNPQLNEEQMTQVLKKYLGITRILWLDVTGLKGDDTDGHIDTIARFIDPHTLCYVQCPNPQDENYVPLQKIKEQLQTFRDYRGHPYCLVPLPWPQPRFAHYDERRLPVTYANFLIINGAVLVPTYEDPADQEVLTIFQKYFPDRKIIPIPSLATIQWYGSVHCMTMQLPAGVL